MASLNKKGIHGDGLFQNKKPCDTRIIRNANSKNCALNPFSELFDEHLKDIELYQSEIRLYLHQSEYENKSNLIYINTTCNIDYEIRATIINWLIGLSNKFSFKTETIYIAISYFDRILFRAKSLKNFNYKFIAVSCFVLASKYEEHSQLTKSKFSSYIKNTHKMDDIKSIENRILDVLDFKLGSATSYHFIITYTALHTMSIKVLKLALFLSELTLLESDIYVKHYPSLIACGSIALARCLSRLPMWNSQLETVTGFELKDFKHIVIDICATHKNERGVKQNQVKLKYKSNENCMVSNINPLKLNIKAVIEKELKAMVESIDDIVCPSNVDDVNAMEN